MRLVASDFYSYFTPSKCGLRVYFRERGEKESPPGAYEEVIFLLGQRHEKAHLATIPGVVDLSGVNREVRLRRTNEEIGRNAPAIYQAVLRAQTQLDGRLCEVLGEPDFLVREDGGYVVRDSKLARHVEKHPEILHQVALYGWLYEQSFGRPPVRLEVHNGLGEIVPLPYDGGAAALEFLKEVLSYKTLDQAPYSPVGWSKCMGCGFSDICWMKAKGNNDVAMVVGVDQGMALAFRQDGIETIPQFLKHFTVKELEGYERPWGLKTQRVGKKASDILRMARALHTGKEELIRPPEVPKRPNYVMFDLEGLPPQMDELGKIYLWGMQVFGDRPGPFLPALAGFGQEGDQQGWVDFLAGAEKIFRDNGDIPFIHWHHYEKTHLTAYVKRYGDRDGIAERVKRNLLDLLPITQKSIALPLYSYSLKVVEKYIRFKRTQKEYGGDWSMAKYIEATETEDEALRKQVMDEILTYNQEDLAATWAVLQWLKTKG